MKILHTSDWHLGQHFMGKSRQNEHAAFIDWLLNTVKTHAIDAVIIAGDVFDTGAPPSYARELYNRFIVAMNQLKCPLIILAGNHDSVATLNESKGLLAYLNTHVIAAPDEDCSQQVLTVNNRQGEPGALVCAIPFIRPKDVLKSQAGESAGDKQQALGQAIAAHYQQVYQAALTKKAELGLALPIIATGHLTAMGVKSSESVREIYIGTLDGFAASEFPAADYIALGHIHRPQFVAKSEHIRYCGSPIALSFDELGSEKQVLVAEFELDKLLSVSPILVPSFQAMAVIKGNLQQIEQALNEFKANTEQTWLCIEVQTDDYLSDLQQRIAELCQDLPVEVLQLRRARNARQTALNQEQQEVLTELSPTDVFERRLAEEPVQNEAQQLRLNRIRQQFATIVAKVAQGEHN
ncbi:exonuclease subunit SbcD [Pseudoalteromonas tunicata]|jgi:exonuclease SbcD|uniref:Nuclease SbcCD subunit D n=1 Tax=Pseudoalteromonas tunicata D2 TaxID=87626 RepID=A4C537_9GAMM|nr:exonuclease subunit SbcD [Pseudoalteromonas tunicata]AXT32996.1 exonuclease subunit SbcD [Pseudoalteromonas tunicata]EAR30669.1 exonuclease SbcD [Pseudoalteromonas tunicata D2]MDP4983674.1 exonuclease subunit SbcD [Pseudoalteromonas tunicata]